MNTEHVLQSFDSTADTSTIDTRVTLTDDSVRVEEIPDDQRAVVVEQMEGTLFVRVYAIDRQTPITLRLPETGGIEIERHDYDMERIDA